MNQQQVTEVLRKLEPKVPEFEVVFTGKTNKKVDGLYKPSTRQIIIHNKNHANDNQLIYTALYEFLVQKRSQLLVSLERIQQEVQKIELALQEYDEE